MIKLGKTVTVAVAMTALLAALAGCEKEGPMEKAGKEVDNAAATVGDKIEKAGENIQDAAKGENDKK
jgi:predicted small lipoprotein YifL